MDSRHAISPPSPPSPSLSTLVLAEYRYKRADYSHYVVSISQNLWVRMLQCPLPSVDFFKFLSIHQWMCIPILHVTYTTADSFSLAILHTATQPH